MEYSSRTNKLKDDEKEESMRLDNRGLTSASKNNQSRSDCNKRIEHELTIDRGGNRYGTRGFGIDMTERKRKFLNPEIESHQSNAGKRKH